MDNTGGMQDRCDRTPMASMSVLKSEKQLTGRKRGKKDCARDDLTGDDVLPVGFHPARPKQANISL